MNSTSISKLSPRLIARSEPAVITDRQILPATNLRFALAGICLGLALVLLPFPGVSQTAIEPRTNLYGIFDVPADCRAFNAIDALGVGWVRQQWQMGDPRSMRKLDVLVRSLPMLITRGAGLWLTIYHRDRSNADESGTVGYARAGRGGFPPVDMSLYQARLEEAVRSLTGAIQGTGTSPGKWLVIQINNEVVPRDVGGQDRASRFWHGTSDQYLAILGAAYEAVKRADPNVPVAVGGISSAAMELILDGEQRVAHWYDHLLREGSFDWADTHLRHRIDDIPAKVAWVQARWNGPIAATEVAGPDPRVEPYSERGQAEDLTARMTIARDSGIDRLFWAGLAENPHVAEIYRKEGLIERGTWRSKAAFSAYMQLIGRR